jgi:hypothetical protein
MKKFVGYIVDKVVKATPRSKKVSPDIKSVPRTKLSIKESLKKTKGDEYTKRIKKLDEGRKKVEEGKKMIKEGQKIRKGMKDTGTAFQFRSKTSYHAMEPGDVKKYKIKKGIAGGD